MTDEDFWLRIRQGDVAGVREALQADPELARRPVRWFLEQANETDPLHFVADCVGHGWMTNGQDGAIGELLIAAGAAIDGQAGRESPLIGAASQGAERLAAVLIEAGAALEATSIFGARALHWAAWTGEPAIVARLLKHGAEFEVRCSEFGATPLFWATHGFGPEGPAKKDGQVAAARLLLAAGAQANTANKQGRTALELARQGATSELYELLQTYL